MAEDQQAPQPQQTLPKMISLKEDGYYSNCTLLESTPFDIAILFGKVRPQVDENGQRTLVEVYEKQVYLSHLQARALFDALGRSLQGLTQAQQQAQQQAEQRAAQKKD